MPITQEGRRLKSRSDDGHIRKKIGYATCSKRWIKASSAQSRGIWQYNRIASGISGKIGSMNANLPAEIQARLNRLERQNRILFVLLCAMVGVASIAATNQSAPGVEVHNVDV
jgi:hypothetical protein